MPNFRAIVSCRIVNQAGNPDFVTLTTGLFPATSTGDSEIEEDLNLPAQCLAPIVFVTSPTGSWFAVTGF